jgi:hypothetical protein
VRCAHSSRSLLPARSLPNLRDIFLEARAQLAYARMAASWLDDQVWEYLGHFDNATAIATAGGSSDDVTLLESQAEFFRSSLQPALSGAIVLSVFSLLEQTLQRLCERHAAYDKDRSGWSQTAGSGVVRASAYLQRVCSTGLSSSNLLRDLNDLRLIRNHLAHRGGDFHSAPPSTAQAAKRHQILRAEGSADPEKILAWMFDLQAALLDKLEEDLVRGR